MAAIEIINMLCHAGYQIFCWLFSGSLVYVEGEDWEETTDECIPHGHNWYYPLGAVPWYILETVKALVEQSCCFFVFVLVFLGGGYI